MNEIEFKKLRFKFIQKCYLMNKCIKIQDQERTIIYNRDEKELNHIFLGKILMSSKKEYYTLLNHNELLRYSIENDEVTEIKFDIDCKDYDTQEENIKQAVTIAKTISSNIQSKLKIKPFCYYSGGKGVHIHFLIKIPNDVFKIKLNDMNYKNFNQDVYDEMNEERRQFKEKLLHYLNIKPKIIKYIDISNSLSCKTLLTLEGAKKRGEGKKYKTKIQHNYDIESIMRFIKSDYNPFIDMTFFEPYEIETNIMNNIINIDVQKLKNEVKEKKKTISNEQTHSKKKKYSQNSSKDFKTSKNNNIDVYEESYKQLMEMKNENKAVFTECLTNSIVRLKEKKGDKSFNTFTYYVLKLLIYLKYSDEEIKIIYTKLIMPNTSLQVGEDEVLSKYETQLKNAKEWLSNNANFKFNYIHNNFYVVFSAKGLMLSVKSGFDKRIKEVKQ